MTKNPTYGVIRVMGSGRTAEEDGFTIGAEDFESFEGVLRGISSPIIDGQ